MPHPCPNLQEILALEAKIRADKHDTEPMPNKFARYVEVRNAAENPLWIKKK